MNNDDAIVSSNLNILQGHKSS